MKTLLLLISILGISLNAQDYTVQPIGYAPTDSYDDSGVLLYNDDQFSAEIPIGFDFEFYGNTYNSLVASGNGVLSFNLDNAGGLSHWNIENTSLPSAEVSSILNSIMLWHDMDISNPSLDGFMSYGTYGTSPNRRFVMHYYNMVQFDGNSGNDIPSSTFQIVLYESMHWIDFYIQHKSVTIWNSGLAILGIQNLDGTNGLAAPDRNNASWTAQNEAWRFTPFDASVVEAFPVSYVVCEETPEGIANFDLTILNDQVSNYRSNVMILYYATELDAQTGTNAFSNPTNFSSAPTTLYVRVEDMSSGVWDVAPIILDIVDCNGDEDNDGVPNYMEDFNGNGNLADDDTDNDGIPNYLDNDDDNDGIPTQLEIISPTSRDNEYTFIDTDNDGLENYLDNNDDNDKLLTIDEDYNQNGTPLDDDQNGNGIPDYLDADVDSLSIAEVEINLKNSEIYPNPVSEVIYIRTKPNAEVKSYQIFHISGKLVKSMKGQNNLNQIDVHPLPMGQYFLKINYSQGFETISFIKK